MDQIFLVSLAEYAVFSVKTTQKPEPFRARIDNIWIRQPAVFFNIYSCNNYMYVLKYLFYIS